ncbi:MAG: hypothetical protein K0S74_1305 [Chlamydiales bacterium]|jgi:uncharacterized Rmd1/YagE family protein|nr:hypothetical protein [Chlamydiales bacterium]
MRCVTYCTASSYNIHELFEFLKSRFSPILYRDVIYVPYYSGEVFFFPYGSIICWEVDKGHRVDLLSELKRFENNSALELESDEFSFEYGTSSKMFQDKITVESGNILAKLAISHALAQSIKLSVFEKAIQKTINNTKHLPEDLANTGKINLSRSEIAQKRGALFIARNSINLHTDILDTPEIFWEYSELEPVYKSTASYLDLSTRVDVLNKRLDIVHELFQMLGDQLDHQHSTSLEWIVITLIFIEIVISIGTRIFH